MTRVACHSERSERAACHFERSEKSAVASRRGFTLVEVLVVLAILGAATAVTVPAIRDAMEMDPMRDATAQVVRLLDRARMTARVDGRSVTVTVDPATARFWVDAPPLAGALELHREASLWSDRARARVTFDAAGTATADQLAVLARGATTPIRVNPFTGEVTTGAR